MSTARSWPLALRWHRRAASSPLRLFFATRVAFAKHEEVDRGDTATEAIKGVPLSYERFFSEHAQALFGYLWRLTGDEQAAHDLSQEAFLRAWRHFDRIQSYDRPSGWLFRVATNLALKHLRHRRVVAGLVVTSVDAPTSTATGEPSIDPTVRLADDDLVREVLLDLAPRQRAVIVLHDVYGFNSAEIASMLASTHAAAKMLLCRARAQFRRRYLRRDEEEVQP